MKNNKAIKPPPPIAVIAFMLKQRGLTESDICKIIDRKSNRTVYNYVKMVQAYVAAAPEFLTAKFTLETKLVEKSINSLEFILDCRDPAAIESIRKSAFRILENFGLVRPKKRGVYAAGGDINITEDNRSIITAMNCDIEIKPQPDEKMAEKGGEELVRFLEQSGFIEEAETVDGESDDQEDSGT